jgi:hypothetical protein
MKYLVIVVLVFASLFSVASRAQDKAPDTTNMQLLGDKVKTDKKLLVATNMNLSDAEAKAFWPVYEAYQKDLAAINLRTMKMISSYGSAYDSNSLTEDLAKKLTQESLAIERAEADMRKHYADRVGKVLPAIKAARYLQIEGKIRALIRYDMASTIPLVP